MSEKRVEETYEAKEVFRKASCKIQGDESDGEVCYGTVPLETLQGVHVAEEVVGEITEWNKLAGEFENRRVDLFTRMLGEQAAKQGGHKISVEDAAGDSVLGKAIAARKNSPTTSAMSDDLSDISAGAPSASATPPPPAAMDTDNETRKMALLEGCDANIAIRRRTRGEQASS